MSTFTKYASIVDAANAHIDTLIDSGLATAEDKALTIEGAVSSLAKIYAEHFGAELNDYGHTAADQMASLLEVVGAKAVADNPLTALDLDVDISSLEDLLGKTVDDLHEDDVEIDGRNIVGTLKYVDDYTGFSSVVEEQSGNYVVLHAAVEDVSSVTITVQYTKEAKPLDADGLVILRVTDQTVPVVFTATKTGYGKVVKKYSLAGLTLEEPEE